MQAHFNVRELNLFDSSLFVVDRSTCMINITQQHQMRRLSAPVFLYFFYGCCHCYSMLLFMLYITPNKHQGVRGKKISVNQITTVRINKLNGFCIKSLSQFGESDLKQK